MHTVEHLMYIIQHNAPRDNNNEERFWVVHILENDCFNACSALHIEYVNINKSKNNN